MNAYDLAQLFLDSLEDSVTTDYLAISPDKGDGEHLRDVTFQGIVDLVRLAEIVLEQNK